MATISGPGLFHEDQFKGRKARPPVFLGRHPVEPADSDLQTFFHTLLKAASFEGLRFRDRIRLDSITCVMDAEQVFTAPEQTQFKLWQFAAAEMLILNKGHDGRRSAEREVRLLLCRCEGRDGS
jgi:hypothetical protein